MKRIPCTLFRFFSGNFFYYFVLLFCVCSIVAFSQKRDTLTLATYTYSTNTRMSNLVPFATYLSKTLGISIRVSSFPDPPSLARGIEAGAVDIAVMNTFGYLLLDANRTASARTGIAVATFHIPKGQSNNYRTVLLARRSLRKEATHSIAQGTSKASTNKLWKIIREQSSALRIAFVSPGSTTGNLIPRLYLASRGVPNAETAFLKVIYAGTHAEALKMVIDGRADIAALASEEYEKLHQQTPEAHVHLDIIWMSEDIKLGPVVVHNSLPKLVQKTIKRACSDIKRDDPKAFTSLRDGWTEAKQADALMLITDRYYNDLRFMFGSQKATRELIEKFAR